MFLLNISCKHSHCWVEEKYVNPSADEFFKSLFNQESYNLESNQWEEIGGVDQTCPKPSSFKFAKLKKHCLMWAMPWVHGRTRGRELLLSNEKIYIYISALLKFVKEHLDVQQYYWQNIIWTDETKVELTGRTQNITCRESPKPTSKPHPHLGTVEWDHGLELSSCLGARTDCCPRCKNEFPSSSRHFSGDLEAMCPPTEAQQKMGDTTQRWPNTHK